MNRIAVALILSTALLSCTASDPVQPGYQLSSVVFEHGTANVYSWNLSTEDSTHAFTIAYRDTFVVRVAGTGESVGALGGLVRLESRPLNNDTMVSSVWYSQTDQDLREVAYSGAGRVPVIQPKLRKGFAFDDRLAGRRDFFVRPYLVPPRQSDWRSFSDTLIARDDPRIVLQYPVAQGLQWTSFTQPFLETREVVGFEQVTVPAGTFNCAKIRTKLPGFDPDVVWYDYVGTEGLIRRSIEIPTVLASGDPVGTDSVTVMENLDLLQRQ